MDGWQLKNVLSGDLGDIFKGVFLIDKIETFSVVSPAAYVFNTKPNAHPGEHWVAVYINDCGFPSYFESYGLPPQQASFIDFLNMRTWEWQHSNALIQSFFNSDLRSILYLWLNIENQ